MISILKKPGKAPEIIEIAKSTRAIKAIIGRDMFRIDFSDGIVLLIDGNGYYKGLEHNFSIGPDRNVAGTALFVGADGDVYCDLDENQRRIINGCFGGEIYDKDTAKPKDVVLSEIDQFVDAILDGKADEIEARKEAVNNKRISMDVRPEALRLHRNDVSREKREKHMLRSAGRREKHIREDGQLCDIDETEEYRNVLASKALDPADKDEEFPPLDLEKIFSEAKDLPDPDVFIYDKAVTHSPLPWNSLSDDACDATGENEAGKQSKGSDEGDHSQEVVTGRTASINVTEDVQPSSDTNSGDGDETKGCEAEAEPDAQCIDTQSEVSPFTFSPDTDSILSEPGVDKSDALSCGDTDTVCNEVSECAELDVHDVLQEELSDDRLYEQKEPEPLPGQEEATWNDGLTEPDSEAEEASSDAINGHSEFAKNATGRQRLSMDELAWIARGKVWFGNYLEEITTGSFTDENRKKILIGVILDKYTEILFEDAEQARSLVEFSSEQRTSEEKVKYFRETMSFLTRNADIKAEFARRYAQDGEQEKGVRRQIKKLFGLV